MLTERQELILETIINDFTQTHEPVGSKTVMLQLPIKVSSATIRNEMVVLEDFGFLEKTHSSSGRVPSASGYRYYLDYLVDPIEISDSVYHQIIKQLDQPFHQVNEIIEEATKILSDLTNYTAFAAGPENIDIYITGFRLVPLSANRVMAILVTDDGNVQNQIYTLPHHTSGDEVEKAVALINKQLIGKSLTDVNSGCLNQIAKELVSRGSATIFLDLLQDVIKDAASEQMYVNGQINLLNNSGINDLNKLRSLYQLIDQKQLMSDFIGFDTNQIINHNSHTNVRVHLGSEMPSKLLEDCSLLTVDYSVGKHGTGTIALLGPSNMPYSQMIGLLEYFRNELANKLLEYYGDFK